MTGRDSVHFAAAVVLGAVLGAAITLLLRGAGDTLRPGRGSRGRG